MVSEEIMQSLKLVLENPFIRVLIILAIVILAHIVARAVIGIIVPKLVRSPIRRISKEDDEKRAETLKGVFSPAAGFIIWIIGILVMLATLGVNIGALATGAGLLGVVIGFGAQKLIQDFLAGIFILLEHQYRIGDVVTLNAGGEIVSGTVEDFTLRITRLRDIDGNLHNIANGSAVIITNATAVFSNVNIDLNVSYHTDIGLVEKVINQVGQELMTDEQWKKHILEPIAFQRIVNFAESAVTVKALGKVQAGSQWDVSGEFRHRVKLAFDKNGIEIPYPQRVINQVKAPSPPTKSAKK